MFRLREFLVEWVHLLVVGNRLADRLVRVALLVIGLGIMGSLQEPLNLLVWGPEWLPSLLPLYWKLSIGTSLVIALAVIYVSGAAGAAWASSRRLQMVFGHTGCADCWSATSVRLEVWNRGWVTAIDDVHVFVDSLTPGMTGRRELSWVGDGRIGIRLRGRTGHAHLELLSFDANRNCFLLIGPPHRLQPGEYTARLTIESEAGSSPVRVLIDPAANPPVSIRRWWPLWS